jgi:hypothetical protein
MSDMVIFLDEMRAGGSGWLNVVLMIHQPAHDPEDDPG